MGKTWLIARHEFAVTLGRLSYRIFVASVPALLVVALIGMAVYQAVTSDDGSTAGAPPAASESAATYGYVDLTAGPDGQPLFTAHRRQGNVTFTPYSDRETATQDLLDGRIDRLYVFPADYLRTGVVVEVREQRAGVSFDDGGGSGALRRFVLENLFAAQLDPERLERLVTPYRIVVNEVSETGAPEESDFDLGDTLVSVAAGVLLLMSGLTASGYLLQGLSEEKENRIMEVLLSSVKPEHLMFGKLAGLGAAGLLQIAVWAAAFVAFLPSLGLIVELPFELNAELLPSPGRLLIALAYFVLGYSLIGTLLAAIGAVTANQRQAGNISALVIVPTILPMWFMTQLLQSPDGTLARVLSFIPITAPVASLARLGLGGMSGLDVAISLCILVLSVALAVWLTARLFRAYLLTFDQQLRLRSFLRTLRGG